jgi:hypothetical protein
MSKQGLEYFSLDVDFFQDEKIQFISSRFGMKGELAAVRLLCKIYRQGYYTDWNNDIALLFAKSVGDGCPHTFVNDVVNELLKRGFFDESIFERFSILTSHGIQKRYFTALERRKKIEARPELLLINPSDYPNILLVEQKCNISGQKCNISEQKCNIFKQSKVKESKVKESKVKESKVKESKVNSCGSNEPPVENQSSKHKPEQPKKPPLREREPENGYERVEKVYLQNWDTLYSQGRVQTPEPVVNWNQTRKLLKNHFEKIKPEQITGALNNGLRDDFVMSGGYSLAVMLSASVLNRLINTVRREAPEERNAYPSGKETDAYLENQRAERENRADDTLEEFRSLSGSYKKLLKGKHNAAI